MPKPLSAEETDEITKLLLKCEDADVADRLTDWERNFITSITEQFANTNWLSPDKQIPKLRQIVENEGGSSREDRRSVSRTQRSTYRSSGEALGSSRGGFSGFGRSSSED